MNDRDIQNLLKMCIRKKRCATRGCAQQLGDILDKRTYYCPNCYGFHHTSQKEEKRWIKK